MDSRMDMSGTTTPKRPRPLLRRSQTASPEMSPPQAGYRGSVTGQAARKLHLHTRHGSKERSERDGQRHRLGHHHHHHHHSSGRAIVDTAKQALPRAGNSSASDKQDSITRGSLSEGKGRRIVRPEDVDRERRRQDVREEELRASLGSLTQLANSMTRRLDTIFYAILEKASSLRAAVDSLEKLSGESIELRHTFESDANHIKNKLQSQIDDIGGLKPQEKAIVELEGRISKGTQRAHALSERLEHARKRVEQWEKREAEWQARTSGRIRASIISVSSVFAGILFLLFLRWVYVNTDAFVSTASVKAQLNNTLDAFSIPFNASRPARSRPTAARQTLKEDSRLQIFDEL